MDFVLKCFQMESTSNCKTLTSKYFRYTRTPHAVRKRKETLVVRPTPAETNRGRKHESPKPAIHGSIYPVLHSYPHPGSKKSKRSDQPVWMGSWTEAFSSSSREATEREADGCQGALRTA